MAPRCSRSATRRGREVAEGGDRDGRGKGREREEVPPFLLKTPTSAGALVTRRGLPLASTENAVPSGPEPGLSAGAASFCCRSDCGRLCLRFTVAPATCDPRRQIHLSVALRLPGDDPWGTWVPGPGPRERRCPGRASRGAAGALCRPRALLGTPSCSARGQLRQPQAWHCGLPRILCAAAPWMCCHG